MIVSKCIQHVFIQKLGHHHPHHRSCRQQSTHVSTAPGYGCLVACLGLFVATEPMIELMAAAPMAVAATAPHVLFRGWPPAAAADDGTDDEAPAAGAGAGAGAARRRAMGE